MVDFFFVYIYPILVSIFIVVIAAFLNKKITEKKFAKEHAPSVYCKPIRTAADINNLNPEIKNNENIFVVSVNSTTLQQPNNNFTGKHVSYNYNFCQKDSLDCVSIDIEYILLFVKNHATNSFNLSISYGGDRINTDWQHKILLPAQSFVLLIPLNNDVRLTCATISFVADYVVDFGSSFMRPIIRTIF